MPIKDFLQHLLDRGFIETTFIVRICTQHTNDNYIIENIVLEYDPVDCRFIWQYDFNEGQPYQIVLGYITIDKVKVECFEE